MNQGKALLAAVIILDAFMIGGFAYGTVLGPAIVNYEHSTCVSNIPYGVNSEMSGLVKYFAQKNIYAIWVPGGIPGQNYIPGQTNETTYHLSLINMTSGKVIFVQESIGWVCP